MPRFNKNIFVISEDFEKRIFISKEISQYGYQIYEFQTLQQALPFSKIKKPDVCIILYNEEENKLPIPLAELIETAEQKCFIILLVNQILKTIEYDLFFKFIRMGISKIFYFDEQPNNFINTNEILREIDEFFDLQYTNHKRILYITNKQEFNNYYIELLKKNDFIVDVLEYPELKEIFFNKRVDLLREDYYLISLNLYYPDFLGIELAQIFRQYVNLKNIPIIYISKEKEIQKHIYAIQKGANFYFIDPISEEIFIPTVNSIIYRYKIYKEQLEKDQMTNIYNHSSLIRKLESKINVMKSTKQSFVYALIDIDYFKKVNDTYGHQAGDQVIINLARYLKNNLSDYHIIGRYGGEEFAVILNINNKEDAIKVMERIRYNFSKLKHRYKNYNFFCTVSIGISMFPEFTTVEELVNAADIGLYESKMKGRNCVHYISKELFKKLQKK